MRYDMPSLQAFHRWEDEITKILGIVEIIVDGKKLDDLKASASVAIPDGAKVQAGPQKTVDMFFMLYLLWRQVDWETNIYDDTWCCNILCKGHD